MKRLLIALISCILVVPVLAVDGPLTALANLAMRTDDNGYLRISAGTAGALDTPLTAMANLRGRTDENGYLRVACTGCGGAVPGADTQVIFNDGGALGADAGLTYNKTTDSLTAVGTIEAGNFRSGSTPIIQGSTNVTYINNGSFTGTNGIAFSSSNWNMRNDIALGWDSSDPGATAIDTGFHRTAAGVISVDNGTAGTFRDINARNYLFNANAVNGLQSTAPTISAGCGTGATIAGKASALKVTIGTTPGTCVINYNITWANAPVCAANNQTTAQLARCTTSTTQVTLAGTIAANDVIHVLTVGY